MCLFPKWGTGMAAKKLDVGDEGPPDDIRLGKNGETGIAGEVA